MRKIILALTAAAAGAFAATPAMAGVTFDTNTSTLSCNTAVGCTQNGPNSVIFGGLTLTYHSGLGIDIQPTSFINLGEIDASGTGGTGTDLTGVLLSIVIDQTSPAGTGTLPGGDLMGIITGNNQSGATITWLSGGVTIDGYNYTVVNNPLAIVPPNSCTGALTPVCGVTSIQGQVSGVPEPATWGLMLLGFAGVGLAMRRRRSPMLAQIA